MTDSVERLRAICLALPEAVEKPFGGHTAPAFRIGDKIFANVQTGDGRVSLVCKAEAGAQGVLVHSDPGRFFVPAYVGRNGWIGVRLDVEIDWQLVQELVHSAYCLTAPKRLTASFGNLRMSRNG